ncbi:immunoglobulin lambda-1 light chain [Pogona vitticeps]
MSSQILLCLSLVLSIHGGALQPVPVQPPQALYAEGETAVLQCPLERGKIQDYHVFWFQQKPASHPTLILKHGNNGQIDKSSKFDARFVPIRDATANAYVLQIQRVRTEESATYWCLAEANYFSIAVSGKGTQLSVRGGTSVKEPSSVFLLSDASQRSCSSTVHALCVAEQFYPGFLEIKWSIDGKDITEGVMPSQVMLNKDGSYSASSILNISHNLLGPGASVKCSVLHQSSGAKAERSLTQCQAS